jgi:transketolase
MDTEFKKQLGRVANAIRQLSMEAVEKAGCGHPGLPMGCAEFAAYLYGCVLRHNPKNPQWLNRDRFILSAGHGSMLLYSSLHLAGFNVSLEEIKRFRQLRSVTPGHPEWRITEGVEATTGPLGQGVGNAVGQALGLKILGEKFNREKMALFNSKVYCLASDGCIMEGISSEASSLAGYLNLDNLVVIYDSNKVCLDGFVSECFVEDVGMRYRAYGWDVYEIDGYDFEEMDRVFIEIRESQKLPCLVIMHTVIGKGAPHKAGTNLVHGSPLGAEELEATKKELGLSQEAFYVPPSVYNFFAAKLKKDELLFVEWNKTFKKWSETFPELAEDFKKMSSSKLPSNLEELVRDIEMKPQLASRVASQRVLDVLSVHIPQLYGGSADLSGSDMTMMKQCPIVKRGQFSGRNIKYGVREFGMAASATGLFQTGMIIPFVGTFLMFSDYMRNAIRVAALSKIQVIYQFTHDSVFLGEDGPTHQPVEHLAALRAIPSLQVIRPADSNEVKMAWIAALQYKGPTALILSRQSLRQLECTNVSYDQGVGRGAYIVKKEKGKLDYTIFATGSEVSLALDVAQMLENHGKVVRVVSMPSFEIFASQPMEYQNSIVGGDIGKRISIEAAVSLGWHQWIGRDGIAISIETFGESAPQEDLRIDFGFTVDGILARLHS